MRINKRLRQAAIHALDLAASNAKFRTEPSGWISCTSDIYREFGDQHEYGDSGPVTMLMHVAWIQIFGCGPESLAGAAALLRDGWSPGEPVVHYGVDGQSRITLA